MMPWYRRFHVAAVAGDIDNFMAVVRQLAYALGVMHV